MLVDLGRLETELEGLELTMALCGEMGYEGEVFEDGAASREDGGRR